jgi:hypothetical protein
VTSSLFATEEVAVDDLEPVKEDIEITNLDVDEEKETVTSSDLAGNLYVHFIDVG